MTLRIYGKPDCCLCEKAQQVADHLQREFGYEIEHIDITRDSELVERYSIVIPVITLDGVEIVRSRVTIAGVRAALAAARG